MSCQLDTKSQISEYFKYTTQVSTQVLNILKSLMQLVPDIDKNKEQSLVKYQIYNQKLTKLIDIFSDIQALSDILKNKVKQNKQYMTNECIRLFQRLEKALFMSNLIKKDFKCTVISFQNLVALRAMWQQSIYSGDQQQQICINDLVIKC